MSGTERRICIVTDGHVGSAPRVVKEADALAAAGNEVHVVAADITPGVRPLDVDVERRAAWKLHRVGRGSRFRWLRGRGAEFAARFAWSVGVRTESIAAVAESRLVDALAHAAAATAPHIVIGHNVAGLAAAARAATRCGCLLGFDAEDDHVGQYLPAEPARSARAHEVQRRWVPRAAVTTASSPMIASALEARYGVRPTVILNCFPRTTDAQSPPVADPLRVYWVSQTIGPDRGIERAIAVLSALAQPWSIDLRGHVGEAYRRQLERLAADSGGRVRFLPTIAPSDVTDSARGYRLGISSEIEGDENRRRCLGNKIFHYLAAGTPVWLSDTPAQRSFAPELGLAGVLLDGDPQAAALQLTRWLSETASQPSELQAAVDRAARRFDWANEARKLVAAYHDTASA